MRILNRLIEQVEKMKPFFEKISRNIYLRAIRDGFIAAIPVLLFSSVFTLIVNVPKIFNFEWSAQVEAMLMKPYDYSMGIFALVVVATTAKSLTDSLNRHMPNNNQINYISTMIAAIIGFLLLSSDPLEEGFANEFLDATGLPTAFLVAFIIPNIYRFFVGRNITIKLPPEVPPNISQTFLDLIPFSVATLFFWLFDIVFRTLVDINFAEGIIAVFQPIFSAADGYLGLALIFGAMSFFWFVGIHGPSIVEPAIAAITYANLDANLQLFQDGAQAEHVLTPGLQMFVATLGGTGATLIITLMFAFMAKSKQNKAVGRASAIPVLFGVNEPFLFGAPVVLNPVFFVPFILAPILNVWIFKVFVDVLGMNSFMYFFPWTTPGPLGLVMGTNFAVLSFVLAILLLAVDFVVYYPFFKVYDKERVEVEIAEAENGSNQEEHNVLDEEGEKEIPDEPASASVNRDDLGQKGVLVLCAGGGTSGQLANALNKGAEETGAELEAGAGAYGAHMDILKDYDMVILAPQVASNYEDIKIDTDKVGVQLISTGGKEYIDLTRDSKKALQFVLDKFNND